MRGLIKCIDKDYNIVYVSKTDKRYINGEVVKSTKMYITAKDSSGNIHVVFNNDNRLKTGELFPVTTKYIIDCKIHGKQQINYHYRLKRVKIPEEYKIYCPLCNEYYLSDKYVPTEEDIENCIIALNKIHFVSSNQQTEKYFKKYMPQFFKIIKNFKFKQLDIPLSFSEKIYFLKNKIFEPPICEFNGCTSYASLQKRPGYGFNRYCKDHTNYNYSSKKENEIYDFIKEHYNGIIYKNYRKLGKELDIYIPKLKLGIEFNGLYWHSEKNIPDKYHHYKKFKFFKEKNINVITIWEDQWKYKKDIVKSIILYAINKINKKIDARKCIIKNVKNSDKKYFLDNNHIQGNCNSSINIGLFYKDELICLMAFGKKRMILNSKSNDTEYELLRFCSKINTVVRGGATKLFNYFIKNFNPSEIISYSNLDIGEGDLYKILKFKKVNYCKPNYWWSDLDKRYHRSGFMKHILVKEGYDSNKTEAEIMNERGYLRIWGVGNVKWRWVP